MKCKEDVGYDSEAVKSFEQWLRRINEFRESVVARNTKKYRKFSRGNESSKRDKKKKDKPSGTIQLVKPRFLPL